MFQTDPQVNISDIGMSNNATLKNTAEQNLSGSKTLRTGQQSGGLNAELVGTKETKEIMNKYKDTDEQMSLNDRLGSYLGSDLRNVKKESDKWQILSRELS